MSTANATAFPVYGQAFRVKFGVYSSLTGLLITGGLTGLAALISKDDGANAATANAPVESGIPGTVYLDLTATEMTCTNALVYLTATNMNAFCKVASISPLQLGDMSGCSLDRTILLFEQIVRDSTEVLYNGGTYNGYNQVLLNRAGTANKALRTVSGAPGNGGTGVAGNLQ